jgi:hypothetical protein
MSAGEGGAHADEDLAGAGPRVGVLGDDELAALADRDRPHRAAASVPTRNASSAALRSGAGVGVKPVTS